MGSISPTRRSLAGLARDGDLATACRRRLAVRARWHQPQCATRDLGTAQESLNHGRALVRVRKRRYRQPRVVREQGDYRVDVAVLDRLRKAADDLALELGLREWRLFASGSRQAGLERRTRGAQQTVHRRFAG